MSNEAHLASKVLTETSIHTPSCHFTRKQSRKQELQDVICSRRGRQSREAAGCLWGRREEEEEEEEGEKEEEK